MKSIRLAEVDNFFKQSFEQKNWFHCTKTEHRVLDKMWSNVESSLFVHA